MQLDIPIYLLLTTIVGAITLTIAILFLQNTIDASIGGGDEACEISRDRICKPVGESEHYYSSGPSGRSGRPAVPRHLRPAAPRTSPTLRGFVDQYRRTAAELAELNAPLPHVPALSRMSGLAALNDGYMSPISQDDDGGNESYRDTYIRRHNYSPASDEHSPCSVAPDNEDVPRAIPRHEGPSEYSPVSDRDWREYSWMHNPQIQRPIPVYG